MSILVSRGLESYLIVKSLNSLFFLIPFCRPIGNHAWMFPLNLKPEIKSHCCKSRKKTGETTDAVTKEQQSNSKISLKES